uniref:hypothetical protein n=1 Tax=uncultured Draconibacterium sp. TaxID=1573823 RepID=UPI003217FD8F
MAVNSDLLLGKYKWVNDNNIFVVGFTWFNNKYVSHQDFIELVKTPSDYKSFKTLAASLNGQFSIIVQHEKEVWLASSHTWTHPVFYKKNNTQYIISDEPEKLISNKTDNVADPVSALYFLNFGVTPKDTTLNKNISQLRPGEIVCLSGTKEPASSFPDFPNGLNSDSLHELSCKELRTHFLESFEKYYEQIKAKQVLLPLTKGYDSRLLACLLAEFGHKNVICVTWGRKDNSEKQTAQKVAEKLGFKYIAVDYSATMIRNFTKTAKFHDYVKFVGHWSSMPFFYEYFGLIHLLKLGVINKDTVAMPGHPGDFLRGSHLNRSMLNFSANEFASHIISGFGTSTPIHKREEKKLHNYLVKNYFSEQKKDLWKCFEKWDLEERQCKFISHSSRIFSFFEMDYFMPLFDRSTIQFFTKIPVQQKIGEDLYNKTLEHHFFEKHGVDFDLKASFQDNKSPSKLKEVIIKLIPHFLKVHYYPVNDDIFYKEITQELRDAYKQFKFKHPQRSHYYNSYIVQWYMQYLDNKSS